MISSFSPFVPAARAEAAPGEFVPLWNAPLLETANGNGTPSGTATKIPANGTMTFTALGKVGVPASGVAALSIGVHAVKPTTTGSLSVYPSDKPTTISSVMFTANESATGSDIAQITSTGKLTVKNNSSAAIDVLISTDGYYQASAAGSVYKPVTTRMLWDTRAQYATGSPVKTTPLAAWSSTEIDLNGQAGLPADPALVAAVALNIGTSDPTADGELKVEPIDAPQGIGTLRFIKNDGNNSVFSIVPTSRKGKLRVTNASPGTVNAVISVRGYFGPDDGQGARYQPVDTTVLVDTAAGVGTNGSMAQLGANQTLVFDAAAATDAPANMITAAALQIRVATPAQAGWITLKPEDKPDPAIASLVYQAGEAANGFDVQQPSYLGEIALINRGAGPIHVQISVRGYYLQQWAKRSPEGQFTPLWETPVMDTRDGTGTPSGTAAKIPANGSLTFKATGRGGIAESGVAAVSFKYTVFNPTATGWLSAGPSDEPEGPSTVTYSAGESATNADFTRITATSQVKLVNHGDAPVDVAVTTDGYFQTAEVDGGKTGYQPLYSSVLYDSQNGTGSPARTEPIATGGSLTIDVAGHNGIPSGGATKAGAVALNVVTTGQTQAGGLGIHPSDAPKGSAVLQFTPGEQNSVFTIAQMSDTGKLTIENSSSGTVHIAISVRGYFAWAGAEEESLFRSIPSKTVLDTTDGTGVPVPEAEGGPAPAPQPVAANASITFDVVKHLDPEFDDFVNAVAVSINAKSPQTSGWLSAYQGAGTDPNVPSVTFSANEGNTGFDTVIPNETGQITVTNHSSDTVDLQVTVRGYYVNPFERLIDGPTPDEITPEPEEEFVPGDTTVAPPVQEPTEGVAARWTPCESGAGGWRYKIYTHSVYYDTIDRDEVINKTSRTIKSVFESQVSKTTGITVSANVMVGGNWLVATAEASLGVDVSKSLTATLTHSKEYYTPSKRRTDAWYRFKKLKTTGLIYYIDSCGKKSQEQYVTVKYPMTKSWLIKESKL